jgi:hypothetical protein
MTQYQIDHAAACMKTCPSTGAPKDFIVDETVIFEMPPANASR